MNCACQHQTSVLQDDVLPHTRLLPPCEVGRVHKHVHSISNSPLTLLCKVLATMFRYKIMYIFVILKPIQTKISVCFDPIIYPPGSHQLAGRLVCLQLGILGVSHIRSSYTSHQRWQRSVQLSSIETFRVSHFRNIP